MSPLCWKTSHCLENKVQISHLDARSPLYVVSPRTAQHCQMAQESPLLHTCSQEAPSAMTFLFFWGSASSLEVELQCLPHVSPSRPPGTEAKSFSPVFSQTPVCPTGRRGRGSIGFQSCPSGAEAPPTSDTWKQPGHHLGAWERLVNEHPEEGLQRQEVQVPLSFSSSLIFQVQAQKQTFPCPPTLQYPQLHPPDLVRAHPLSNPQSPIRKRRKRKVFFWNPV